jgi:hypothetical protein
MAFITHSLVLGTDSNWEQVASYSCKPSNNWRSLSVSAHLSWPEDLIVNGRHKGSEMNWRVECYDNTLSLSATDSENSLGKVSFQKDMTGYPSGIIVLSLKNHGFQELWERATHQLLTNSTIALDVVGILPPDDEHTPLWFTSHADQLFVRGLELHFNQEAATDDDI